MFIGIIIGVVVGVAGAALVVNRHNIIRYYKLGHYDKGMYCITSFDISTHLKRIGNICLIFATSNLKYALEKCNNTVSNIVLCYLTNSGK